MFNPQMVSALQKGAQTLPQDIAGMRSQLERQTDLLEAQLKAQEKAQAANAPRRPIFIHLTDASLTFQTSQTLDIVDAFWSASAASQIQLMVSETEIAMETWNIAGGFQHVLPLKPEYPLTVGRGQRIWVNVIAGAANWHLVLVAFPVISAQVR